MKQYLILTFYQRIADLKNELPITKVSKSVVRWVGCGRVKLLKLLKIIWSQVSDYVVVETVELGARLPENEPLLHHLPQARPWGAIYSLGASVFSLVKWMQ